MIDSKTLLWMVALVISGISPAVHAKCNAEARAEASALRQQAASESNVEQAVYLLRSSAQLCEDYNTWMALGRREIARNDPDFAADYFYRARSMYQPDVNGQMSVGRLRRLATTNVLLASALTDARLYADALDALETAKRFFAIYRQGYPERLLSLQARIDDGMSSAPASTLTRSMNIQRSGSTRGVGIRVKPEETNDEFISEDAELLQQENLGDIIDDQPLIVATAESTPQIDQSPAAAPTTETDNSTNSTPATAPAEQSTSATRLNIQVLFDFDSDQINATGEAQVIRMADALRNLALPEATEVQIIGHTDINGSAAYNLGLSERRATSVVAKISGQLPGLRLVALGKGETEPRYPGTNRDDHRRNRRVEIVIN